MVSPDSGEQSRAGSARPAVAGSAVDGSRGPDGLPAADAQAGRGVGEGGRVSELTGLWRTAPLPASLLLFSVIGLAGLPPALAGTFAKVAVLEVLASSAVWLAVVVAAGAVLGLAYYLPLARTLLLGRPAALAKGRYALGVALVGLALLAVSLAPQLVLEFTSALR